MNQLKNTISEILEKTIKYREGYFLISAPPKSFFNPNPRDMIVHISKSRNDWLMKTARDYPTSGQFMKESDWNRIKREATAAEIGEFKKTDREHRKIVDDQMQSLRSLD